MVLLRAANWLCLAAAPTFAVMALLVAVVGGSTPEQRSLVTVDLRTVQFDDETICDDHRRGLNSAFDKLEAPFAGAGTRGRFVGCVRETVDGSMVKRAVRALVTDM